MRFKRPDLDRTDYLLILLLILSIMGASLGYYYSRGRIFPTGHPVPDLKLPLPGDRSWLLTVESGGKAFRGGDDRYHKGGGHFALDFDDLTKEDGPLTDAPVLAAGDGKVVEACGSFACRFTGSGYSVVISHSDPYDGAGYETMYGHLKEPPNVSEGDTVKQGDIIGTVGSTGLSGGTHLHFRMFYNQESGPSVKELKRLLLDGLPIERYKVNPDGDSLKSYYYYRSTNINPKAKLQKRN